MVKQLLLACIVLFVLAVGKAQESKTLSSTAQPLLVPINRIPFSVRGSYLVIQNLDSQNHIVSPQIAGGLYLRNILRRGWYDYMLKLEVLSEGSVVEPQIMATPERLVLLAAGGHGRVECVFDSLNTIRIRGTGLGLRIRPSRHAYVVPMGVNSLQLHWSAIVAPQGLYKREAMLMSKNWMNTLYSWDHCRQVCLLIKIKASNARRTYYCAVKRFGKHL